eukprot:750703-Amphidinium_carterae.1
MFSLLSSLLQSRGGCGVCAPLFLFVEFAPCRLRLASNRNATKDETMSKSTLRIPLWVLRLVKRGVWETSLNWEGLGTLIAAGCCQFLDGTLFFWGATDGGGVHAHFCWNQEHMKVLLERVPLRRENHRKSVEFLSLSM